MFTKTQIRIMKVFAASIVRRFSIKEIADTLKSPYPLIHRSIQDLLKGGFIAKDEKDFLSLNYKGNNTELVYIEALRAKDSTIKENKLSLFINDVLERVKEDFFVFLIFGSYVEKLTYRDIDFLFIIEDESRVNEIERTLENIADNFTNKIEIQVISVKSAHEMLSNRDKVNIMNETLNKHILLFGTENYYRMIKNAR